MSVHLKVKPLDLKWTWSRWTHLTISKVLMDNLCFNTSANRLFPSTLIFQSVWVNSANFSKATWARQILRNNGHEFQSISRKQRMHILKPTNTKTKVGVGTNSCQLLDSIFLRMQLHTWACLVKRQTRSRKNTPKSVTSLASTKTTNWGKTQSNSSECGANSSNRWKEQWFLRLTICSSRQQDQIFRGVTVYRCCFTPPLHQLDCSIKEWRLHRDKPVGRQDRLCENVIQVSSLKCKPCFIGKIIYIRHYWDITGIQCPTWLILH